MDIINTLIECIRGKNLKIVFPEGCDIRILKAAKKLRENCILNPIILGSKDIISKLATKNSIDLNDIDIINPEAIDCSDYYIKNYLKLQSKTTEEQARTLLKDSNYFGAMMVHLGEANGMISGAVHASSDTIRPALQIIKPRDDIHRISGAMLMIGPNGERRLLADIAVNPKVNARELAEIAIESAATARTFGIDPKIAMLSFSTNGSASSTENNKIIRSIKIAKKLAPNLCIDGEMQFDAAIVGSIGARKMPGSAVAGQANVFIFPDLNSGNIAYKIMQHLGGYSAFGPLLQGLNKPINDLSRGCTEDDVYNIAIITAAQSLNK
jgi:phosphate acetyltransferase